MPEQRPRGISWRLALMSVLTGCGSKVRLPTFTPQGFLDASVRPRIPLRGLETGGRAHRGAMEMKVHHDTEAMSTPVIARSERAKRDTSEGFATMHVRRRCASKHSEREGLWF
jgi:hypothetical protein